MKTSFITLLLFLTPSAYTVTLEHLKKGKDGKDGKHDKNDEPVEHLYDPEVVVDIEEELVHEIDEGMHDHHDEILEELEELDHEAGDPLPSDEVENLEEELEEMVDWAMDENDE